MFPDAQQAILAMGSHNYKIVQLHNAYANLQYFTSAQILDFVVLSEMPKKLWIPHQIKEQPRRKRGVSNRKF